MTTTTKKYVEGIGRRKEAVARVRVADSAKAGFLINNKPIEQYFFTETQREVCALPISLGEVVKKLAISVHVRGGGLSSQAGAVSLGLARALSIREPSLRVLFKSAGLLSRNARVKERRKFGLKKARKAPQWSKR